MLLALTMLTACSSDNDDTTTREITLDIPIEIYSADLPSQVRAASQGDPGNDASLEPPLFLYVYAYVSEGNGSSHELLKMEFPETDGAAIGWKLVDEGTREERWQKIQRVTFTISSTFDPTIGNSRVYAIASRTNLSTMLPEDILTKATKDALESVTMDLSTLTSDDLKDIYSTPANDKSNPVQSTDNGIIIKANDKSLTCSTVKLYHVAAKVDFTWEVAQDLQSTVELKKIYCTGVPTTCAIFKPTENPATATTTSYVLSDVATDKPAVATTPGNKWLGRACAYMLQPPSPGKINYTVEYGGTGSHANTTSSITPDASTYSNVYTGWYRVVADVK